MKMHYTIKHPDFMNGISGLKEERTLYLKIHRVTGLRYLGVTLNDAKKYIGSGTKWKNHLKKYGNDVRTHILFKSDDIDEFCRVATKISERFNIVKDNKYANSIPENGSTTRRSNRKIYEEDTKDCSYIPTKFPGGVVYRKSFHKESEDVILHEDMTLLYKDKKKSDFDLDDIIYKKELKMKMRKILSSLTPKEEKVIRMRFGIGMNTDYTLVEVGKVFSLDKERIRQVEAKALRKLKHHSRNLKTLLECA